MTSVDRQEREADLERVVAEHALEVERAEEEHRRTSRRPSSAWISVGAGDRARAEDPQRHQRVARPSPRGRRRRRAGRARRRRARACAARPSRARPPADDRVDAEHQRAGDQRRAGDVGALAAGRGRGRARAAAARAARWRSPIGRLTKKIQCQLIACGEHAAGEQADRAAGRGDEGVDADRLRLLARLREHRHDHPEDHRRGRARRRRPGRSARRPASPGSAPAPQTSEATVKTREAGEEDAARGRSGRRAGRRAAAGRRRRSGRR